MPKFYSFSKIGYENSIIRVQLVYNLRATNMQHRLIYSRERSYSCNTKFAYIVFPFYFRENHFHLKFSADNSVR